MKMPELTNAQFAKTSHFSCGNVHLRKTAAMLFQSKNWQSQEEEEVEDEFYKLCVPASASKINHHFKQQQQHQLIWRTATAPSTQPILKIHLLNKLNKKISITYGNCAQSWGNTLYIGNGTSIITALSIMMSSVNEIFQSRHILDVRINNDAMLRRHTPNCKHNH